MQPNGQLGCSRIPIVAHPGGEPFLFQSVQSVTIGTTVFRHRVMKLNIIAVGHKMPDWISEGYNEFAKRMPRDFALTLTELKPDKRISARTPQQVMAEEAERILAAIPNDARVLAMDERGANWTTMKLAENMKQWQVDARETVFIIGGTDGLDPKIKQRADQLLQLSAMTLPHGMVRVMLAEQLYRAVSILNNHPYHRE